MFVASFCEGLEDNIILFLYKKGAKLSLVSSKSLLDDCLLCVVLPVNPFIPEVINILSNLMIRLSHRPLDKSGINP